MSRNDFSICTPSEFSAIAEAWSRQQEQLMQSEWERTRFLTCYMLQPHLKSKMTPQQLISFPWEKKEVDSEPKKTKAERQAEFEKYKELWK